jgi:hypothetical protein
MIVKLTKMTPILFAGAAAAAIAAAPVAGAQPPPPPCLNWDGTPCSSIGNITDDGAVVNVPNGPAGAADWGGAQGVIPYGPEGSADTGGAEGSLSPWGPGGAADPGGASGCLPNIGCINIPAP